MCVLKFDLFFKLMLVSCAGGECVGSTPKFVNSFINIINIPYKPNTNYKQ